jgi:sialate O-acetylesterase
MMEASNSSRSSILPEPRLMKRLALCLALLATLATTASADVKLPSIFTSNMVLQRDRAVPVWGWADAGERVTVSFARQTKSAKTDDAGKWTIQLDALKTSTSPRQLKVSGKNTLKLENVLVGEVWICSGQSNMAMSVARSNNAEEEIANAKYPLIRLVTVPRIGTQDPQYEFEGEWAECSPQTVGNFSAAAYYFGRKLNQELKIPIGLVHTSWGGSACEAWVRRDVLEADTSFHPLLAQWDELTKTFDYEKRLARYQETRALWMKKAKAARQAKKPVPRAPRAPQNILAGQHRPANLYNGMIVPILPLAARGAIWYQGESNGPRGKQYRTLFPTMIKNWRNDFGQNLSFYFVQLANFRERLEEPADADWAELREAQSMTLSLPKTGQAVIIDVGEAKDIHPKDKQTVGLRLALNALAKDYGKKIVFSGPVYKSMSQDGASIVLEFDHVGSGLALKSGRVGSFAIAGADKKFVWADTVKIEGDSIRVSHAGISKPVAVRYAWANNPEALLYNKDNIPASPFRTDDWAMLSEGKVTR